MITYRKATAADCPEMSAMLTDAFDGYPIYAVADGHLKKDHTSREMLSSINTMLCNLFMRYGKECFIADDDGTSAGIIMPEAPDSARISMGRVLLCGGLDIMRFMPLKTALEYAMVLTAPEAERKVRGKRDMYLLNIAVNELWRGQGLGRGLIFDCAVPYAREKGCNRLTLNTNTRRCVDMYAHMGFELLDKVHVSFAGQSVTYYPMALDIDTIP